MRRFFINQISENILIEGEEHNHLAFVLRSKVGDKIIICNGDGYDYIAEIENISKTKTTAKIVEKKLNDAEPKLNLTLFQAILKGDKMDFVCQKATELGVKTIYPLVTQFIQVKKESVKTERLNKITLEAAKQCGRAIVPQVQQVINFKNMAKLLPNYDLVVFPYEKAMDMDIKTYLHDFNNLHKSSLNNQNSSLNIALIVGSEGGFSDEEAAELTATNIIPLTLGKRIMRAETASIAVISAIMYELGEWA